MPNGSKIFVANRALGYVSNHIPLQVRYIKSRKENLVTTCVGKSFHTYGLSHFSLLSVSGLHGADITCMSADTYHVYTASENTIYAWRRGNELKHRYRGHGSAVHVMLPFGAHLVSVDEDSVLKVWDIKTEQLFSEMAFSNAEFKVSCAMHPATYVNKVLLASEQGALQLWNINAMKQIYRLEGWGCAVTVLEQAPALDVVAVGLGDGRVLLHNLRYDETLMELAQDWGRVTSISFRTDGPAIMATGSAAGHIVFWDLEGRKTHSQLVSAHGHAVTGLAFVSNEPLLLTSSSDNSLKLWIFDSADLAPRLLRLREGHAADPTSVRFHGADGHNVLSASADSTLRIFSTLTETFNKSLGVASHNRKASKKRSRDLKASDPLRMPPIVSLVSETARQKQWDNIAALHHGIATVSLWSYDRLKMSDIKLLPKRFRKKNAEVGVNVSATCLALTRCGNFLVVGYSSGHVDRFNMQSGFCRGTYGMPKAHDCPVRGVSCDSLNNLVVSGASDGTLLFWPFKCQGSSPRRKVRLDEGISFMRWHCESGMLAVALEDFSVVVVDLETQQVIRKLGTHAAQLTDVSLSADGRWLCTASMDGTIKCWDLPSGQLLDHLLLQSPCTSLDLSPTGEYLATCHVDRLGVYLWTNRTLYQHITLRPLPPDVTPALTSLPDCAADAQPAGVELECETPHALQQVKQLATLSGLATSRWKNLLDVDLIRRRNRPKEAAKAPKSAPFFLPTVPSLSLQFDLRGDSSADAEALRDTPLSTLTPLARTLQEDGAAALRALKGMGPSLVDSEIKALSPYEGGSVHIMRRFLQCIGDTFQSNRDFETAQSYLGVFLKHHGRVIADNGSLRDLLPRLQHFQSAAWLGLHRKLLYCLCVTRTIKSA